MLEGKPFDTVMVSVVPAGADAPERVIDDDIPPTLGRDCAPVLAKEIVAVAVCGIG